MKVAVLGYGVEGASAVGYWHHKGAEITVCDRNTELLLPSYVAQKLGDDYLSNLSGFDVIVRSPSVHPKAIASANSPEILQKVTTTTIEFFKQCPAPIIGVTGTKGKGTTSTLIYKMLQAAGKKAFIGGNIGTVPLDFLKDVTPDSIVVLELSNFQLIDFTERPDVGVCLMVAPEHLDWHETVKEYYAAKQRLFANQTAEDRLVYNARNEISTLITKEGKADKVGYYVPHNDESTVKTAAAYVDGTDIMVGDLAVCSVNDISLLGRHNLENVCAAISAVWKIIDGDVAAIKTAAQEFSGLEHRLEFVREVNGVRYYNDSFATTPEATIAATRAFSQPKIIILGGTDKGIPFFDVATEIANSELRAVIAIGTMGPKIAELLEARGVESIITGKGTMQEIVDQAAEAARPGDVVLLSASCASFDMFKNYKDRGEQFKSAVQSLA